MKRTILFFLLVTSISCASSVNYQSFTTIKYAPVSTVDVYMTEKPDQEYKEIGRIGVTEGLGGDGDMVKQAIKKAKKVGADGIILLEETKDTRYIVSEDMVIPASVKYLAFVAIKYIQKQDGQL